MCLYNLGYKKVNPPLKIEYPEYAVDIDKFEKNLQKLIDIVSGNTKPTNYFERRYSFYNGFDEGFSGYMEHIRYSSNIRSLPLIKLILEDRYPLPNKRVIFDKNESWKAGEYVYPFSHKAAAKTLLNIADDRLNDLLRSATDIPEAYFRLLEEAAVILSADDYWDYLLGKYSSRAHKRVYEGRKPIPNPLVFVQTKLKANLRSNQYPDYLYKLYKITDTYGRNEKEMRYYQWKTDKARLAKELFNLDLPEFTAMVKDLLPQIEADTGTREDRLPHMESPRMMREYMLYLYRQGEYDFLTENLKSNKNLMKVYLAEDVKETFTTDSKTKEIIYYGIEECLIQKMPEVTKKIKKEIASFMKREAKNYSYYRWWIRNRALIDREKAEILAKELYLNPINPPHKYEYRIEKGYILRGASEGQLRSLCSDVLTDLNLDPTQKDKKYYYLAPYRLMYLRSSCPSEMNKFIRNLYSQKKSGRKWTIDLSNKFWMGVAKYFPKEKREQILCKNNSIKIGNAHLSNIPTIKCVCEEAQKYLSPGKHVRSSIIDYLNLCYPEKKEQYKRIIRTSFEREISNRTYEGFISLVKHIEHLTDPRFKAFFFGTTSNANIFKSRIDWSKKVSANDAKGILAKAINSEEDVVQRAAFYAFSFYPNMLDGIIIKRLQEAAIKKKFPENLYAAHSLAMYRHKGPIISKVCEDSAKYFVDSIKNYALSRYENIFSRNILITFETCGIIGNGKNYLKLLDLILNPGTAGRYETFQTDLERILQSVDISVDEIVSIKLNSKDSVDIIIGFRLAELKYYAIDFGLLKNFLNHDDSYVRLAATKYIISQNKKNKELLGNLKLNTNRKVRNLVSTIN